MTGGGHEPGRLPPWAAPAGLVLGALAGLVALLNGLPDLFERTLPWLGSTVMIAGASVPLWSLMAVAVLLGSLALLAVGARSARSRNRSSTSSTSSAEGRRGESIADTPPPPVVPAPRTPAPVPAGPSAPPAIDRVQPLRGIIGEGEQLLWDVARQRGPDPVMHERVREWLARASAVAEDARPGAGIDIREVAAVGPVKHPGYAHVTEYSFRSPDGGITSVAANEALRAPMERDHGGGLRLGVPEVVEGPLAPGHNVRIRLPFNDKPADTRARKRLDHGRLPYLDPDLDVMRSALTALRRLEQS